MELSQSELKELLHYDEETGVFTRKKDLRGGFYAGEVAGSIDPSGYIRISVKNKPHWAHRLAWLYIYGDFPSGIIDHINREKSDNRISNLRVVSGSENHENKIIAQKSNVTSGLRGVHWVAKTSKWRAQIQSKRKTIHIGYFDCKHEAYDAYLIAKANIHPGFSGVNQ